MPTSTLPPTTTSSTTTTTVAPTTTADAAILFPDTHGDDWLRIMTEINDFANWLEENPDPALVDYIVDPEGGFYERFAGRIAEYSENGWREALGDVTETLSVDVDRVARPDQQVFLRMVIDSSPSTVLDVNRDPVREYPAVASSASVLSLSTPDLSL